MGLIPNLDRRERGKALPSSGSGRGQSWRSPARRGGLEAGQTNLIKAWSSHEAVDLQPP